MAPLVYFMIFILFFSCASACDQCVLSKAKLFSSPSAISAGACGYGSLALKLNGGHIANGIPSLFKDGAGCGACFQIRCKDNAVCSKAGTKVILTGIIKNNATTTDLELSSRAFRAMALAGKDLQLLKQGIADVEYRRVPCDYKRQNLAIRVEESSKTQGNLVIKILYQGGQTEIVAIDVAQVGKSNWTFMSRKYGAVWETSRAPAGVPLQFRFVVTAGFDGKHIWAKNVLPANWKPGVIYDTNVQIDDIALEGCKPCTDRQWN